MPSVTRGQRWHPSWHVIVTLSLLSNVSATLSVYSVISVNALNVLRRNNCCSVFSRCGFPSFWYQYIIQLDWSNYVRCFCINAVKWIKIKALCWETADIINANIGSGTSFMLIVKYETHLTFTNCYILIYLCQSPEAKWPGLELLLSRWWRVTIDN